MTTLKPNPTNLLDAFFDSAHVTSNALPYVLRPLYTMTPNKGGGWLMVREGKRYKIRCMTEKGVDFAPSSSKGVGRARSQESWHASLAEVDGFVIYDAVRCREEVLVWEVSTTWVLEMQQRGIVDYDGRAKRSALMTQLMQLTPNAPPGASAPATPPAPSRPAS